MHLTTGQERLLAGQEGDAARRLFSVLVDIGDAGGADQLIPITCAHVAGVSYLTGKEGLRTFLRETASAGLRARVPATTNPCGMDREQWGACGQDPDFAAKQRDILESYATLGMDVSLTCTPYEAGALPREGDHVAWSESSAIVTVNSYFGARTNRESGVSSLAAALFGLTPDFGLHRDGERRPTLRVRVDVPPDDLTTLSLVGESLRPHLAGSTAPNGPIPLITGLRPLSREEFKALAAPLGTHGCALAHVVGTTPEAGRLPAADAGDLHVVGHEEVRAVLEAHRPASRPDLVVLCCPQGSLTEVRAVARMLTGRKVRNGTSLWVFTSAAVARAAAGEGLTGAIAAAGGRLLADTCPEVMAYPKGRYASVLADSMKAVEYIRSKDLNNLPCGVLPTRRCVAVALGEEEVG